MKSIKKHKKEMTD